MVGTDAGRGRKAAHDEAPRPTCGDPAQARTNGRPREVNPGGANRPTTLPRVASASTHPGGAEQRNARRTQNARHVADRTTDARFHIDCDRARTGHVGMMPTDGQVVPSDRTRPGTKRNSQHRDASMPDTATGNSGLPGHPRKRRCRSRKERHDASGGRSRRTDKKDHRKRGLPRIEYVTSHAPRTPASNQMNQVGRAFAAHHPHNPATSMNSTQQKGAA